MLDRPAPRLTRARRQLLDGLLDRALDMDADERKRWLAGFARRYPRLHLWLARLIEASQTPTAHLQGAVARTAERVVNTDDDVPQLEPGVRLGSWRVVGQAGRGGMGVVYRAERADGAFEMEAAIKLIGSRHPGVVERLIQERQLLARLNHAGISRLIDGGLTEDGQAYLVMEWVRGEDLSERIRADLDPLKTFGEVADALTHAHQRMVVHGDIKPGNVRITPNGRARLLDFGVARLLADESGDPGLEARALTPAYAAPELFDGQPATAQSDVWALGALLLWLLTGRRPAGDGSAPDPSGLTHGRAADLAAIISRACAGQPADRYPSVAALAEDVRRIREHHPVQARPAGPLRRLRLWSRRNPVGAMLAVALTLGVVAGAAVFGWQAQVVRAERDLARFENTRWEIMRDQLVELFGIVALESDQDELGARELLDGSVDRLEELLAEDDRGKAYIESMLGSLYVALQDYQNAAVVLRRFVEADDGTAAPILRSDAYGDLALSEAYLGNHERALALIDEAISMVEDQPGDYRRRLSELYQTRGSALRGLGDWEASLDSLEHGLSLAKAVSREPNRTLAMGFNNYGVSLNQAGLVQEARDAFEGSLENWRALGLEESSDALTVISNLAAIYHQQGDLALAESAYSEAIKLRAQRFGESAALAAAMNNYAQVLIVRYRLDEAKDQLDPAREMMARFNGENSPHHAIMLRSLGLWALTAGDVERAEHYLSRAEGILLDTVGPEHLFTVIVRSQAAQALAQRDRHAALDQLDRLVDQMAGMGSAAATHRAAALCEQAVIQIDLGRMQAAQEAAERCRDIRLERLAEGHWELDKAQALIAAAAYRLGDPEAGLALATRFDQLADVYGAGHPRLAWLENQLAP